MFHCQLLEKLTPRFYRLLLIEYVADARKGARDNLLAEKEKRKLIIPVGDVFFRSCVRLTVFAVLLFPVSTIQGHFNS